jgi:hypothetical protein
MAVGLWGCSGFAGLAGLVSDGGAASGAAGGAEAGAGAAAGADSELLDELPATSIPH